MSIKITPIYVVVHIELSYTISKMHIPVIWGFIYFPLSWKPVFIASHTALSPLSFSHIEIPCLFYTNPECLLRAYFLLSVAKVLVTQG